MISTTKSGPPTPIGIAVPGRPAREEDGHVGAAVVVGPALVAIADVDARPDLAEAGQADHALQDEREPGDEALMLIVRERRHDVDSLPDLIPAVGPPRLALGLQSLRDRAIDHQHGHDPSLRFRRPSPAQTAFRPKTFA
jgi:hypothetical protein